MAGLTGQVSVWSGLEGQTTVKFRLLWPGPFRLMPLLSVQVGIDRFHIQFPISPFFSLLHSYS
jgi:hypothetical protein